MRRIVLAGALVTLVGVALVYLATGATPLDLVPTLDQFIAEVTGQKREVSG